MEPVGVSSVAAAELATPTNVAATGKVDLVKNTYLVPSDMLPDQFKELLYSLTREDVVYKKIPFRVALNKNILSLLRAINGREQNNMIRIDQVQHGIPVQPELPPERPNLADRILGSEKVQEYERWKERKELGLE